MTASHRWLNVLVAVAAALILIVLAYGPARPSEELENRIPRAAPYVTAEAAAVPPPFERYWKENHNPGKCSTCHSRIFSEWNGSMMSNSWRDPGWRGAFLLVARQTSTAGNCDVPNPPDGTERARLNPFANADCSASFDLGTSRHRTSRPGSLLDGFCAQCHMPTNFVDNVTLGGLSTDPGSGLEHGRLDPKFNPTSDNGTGLAFATVEAQIRNTDTGKRGIFCAACHTMADTREMPYGNYRRSDKPLPAEGTDRTQVPAPEARNLGFAVGAGSYRLSPKAIASSTFLGPLSAAPRAEKSDPYLSGVFAQEVPYNQGAFNGHKGAYQTLHERAELCSACHDVTNPLTIKNPLGKWVGGFPIERTYTEWSNSRYADRPGNQNFDPRFKRDCQTCHMQQDFGQPGTAQTLYRDGHPVPPLTGSPKNDGPVRTPSFSHHFIGGNAYVDRMIGADVDEFGSPESYPQLSTFSFSSADPKSPYNNAYWTNVSARGPQTQHARLAWDRLRNVLDLQLQGPRQVAAGEKAPLHIAVTNTGTGHNFPSGFPEGRAAWVAVRAYDLATGGELSISDSFWKRTSLGVGYLTRSDLKDPKYPHCDEELPAGSPDPYAFQMKAVASLGDGCPTLALAYATPLNLVVNSAGLPIDAKGKVIDRENPRGLPQFRDLDGDGDLFDDSYLADTRLRPLPHPGAKLELDRYSVVVPAGTRGPVAVTAAVYYQSFEGIVAMKFLGNLADLDGDFKLEPCVLGGACDGRTPTVEPAVVEGAPPVPMAVKNWLFDVQGSVTSPGGPPINRTYPAAGATDVYQDAVLKISFSEPVHGVDAASFTLTDAQGTPVPAFVDQIGDGTWGLFPHRVFLEGGRTYHARLAAGICGYHGNCTRQATEWSFTVTAQRGKGSGNTSVPLGFRLPPAVKPVNPASRPAVAAVSPAGGDGHTSR